MDKSTLVGGMGAAEAERASAREKRTTAAFTALLYVKSQFEEVEAALQKIVPGPIEKHEARGSRN